MGLGSSAELAPLRDRVRVRPPEIQIHDFHECRRATLTTAQAFRTLDNSFAPKGGYNDISDGV
jgi:hypothetical protein